jgi:chorismate mutase
MKPNPDKVRGDLGELAAMANQTDAMERKILKMATDRLEAVEAQLEPARTAALAGDEKEVAKYQDLINERGTLHQVIAKAKENLGQS